MKYDFTPFENKLKEVSEWLKNEFLSIRTGRASATLLDRIKVSSYGAMSPLNQVSNIISEDAKTLRISPWDTSMIVPIEKAITEADLGVSTSVDEKGLRVIFPELSSERREILVKQVGKKLEEAKVSIRNERDEVQGDINKKFKDGEMGEDDKFRLLDEMQKRVVETQKKLEELAVQKEAEIKN